MFTDRYYTSIPLAEALHDRATSFTGTTNKNRVNLPDELRATCHLRDGEVMAFRADHLLTLAWRAKKKKKPVIMLSSNSSAATEGATEKQIKPVVVHTYNKHMNGVDIADQHSTYYCFLRKTIKWWRKLCFWLLETAVVNSFVLYKDITKPARPNHLAYRHSIVESLASKYLASAPPRQRIGRPRKRRHPDDSDPPRLNQQLHLLDKHIQFHDCVVCSSRSTQRHRTQYFCKTCIDTPSLCPHPCFERYHTLSHFRS